MKYPFDMDLFFPLALGANKEEQQFIRDEIIKEMKELENGKVKKEAFFFTTCRRFSLILNCHEKKRKGEVSAWMYRRR